MNGEMLKGVSLQNKGIFRAVFWWWSVKWSVGLKVERLIGMFLNGINWKFLKVLIKKQGSLKKIVN